MAYTDTDTDTDTQTHKHRHTRSEHTCKVEDGLDGLRTRFCREKVIPDAAGDGVIVVKLRAQELELSCFAPRQKEKSVKRKKKRGR